MVYITMPEDIQVGLQQEVITIQTSFAEYVRLYIALIVYVNVWVEIVSDVVRKNRQNVGILHN